MMALKPKSFWFSSVSLWGMGAVDVHYSHWKHLPQEAPGTDFGKP